MSNMLLMINSRKDSPMFIVKTFITKPADKAWYKQDPALGQTLAQLNANDSSIIKSRTRKINANKKFHTKVFASQDAYTAWEQQIQATPQWKARQDYYDANGFVVVKRKFLLVP